MANTGKRVKKTTRKTTTRRRAPAKRTAKKTAARKAPARKAPARRRAPAQPRTTATALAELLPEPVGQNEYVSRTLTILEADERRRARSRATRSKQLEKVASDVRQDLVDRINGVEQAAVETLEGLAARVTSTSIVRQAIALPDQVTEQVTEAVDTVLDRVGLMRKARCQRTRALPRRRRAA